MPTTTQDLVDGLDWALAQNTRAGSPYRGKIDPAMVAASGFSCGGVQALGIATSDARVKALIVQNSGLFPADGTPLLPGMDLPKSALANLTMPVLYIQGGPTDIAWNNGFDDYTRINHVPIALVGLPTGHGGTYFDPHGGAAAMIAVDWLEWQLRGDEDAGAQLRRRELPDLHGPRLDDRPERLLAGLLLPSAVAGTRSAGCE